MSINLRRILVTGARAPVTLHLCRILHESGHDVYAADSVSYALTKKSNSIKDFFLLPSPKFHTNEFIASLVELIQANRIDLLIPTCEESFYLSTHKETLSRYCEVFVGDFEPMKMLHNKYEFIQYAKQLGLLTPKTLMLSHKTMKQDVQNYFENEVVLKRIYSRFSDNVLFLHKDEYEPTRYNFGWIAQEKLEGVQYCSYSIAKNGKILAHSVYQTVFTAGLGATIAFQFCERRDIEHIVTTIVEDLHFTGQISFDFIVNNNNIAIPIECNPRATSGLHLFNQKVANCFLNQTKNTLYPDKNTKMAITLAMIAYAFGNFKRNRSALKWLKILFSHRDIAWSSKDMKPMFYQFISMYLLWKESRKHKRTMIQQSTSDISWDDEIL